MKKGALVPVAAAAVLFGAIGFGAGLVLGPATAPPSGTAASTVGEAGAPDAPDEREGTSAPRERAERTRGSATGRERATADDPFQTALKTLPVPEIEAGEGVITASVKTQDGVPVEGVKLLLTPHRPPAKNAETRPDEEIPVEELIAAYAERLVWERAARQEAVTDADGNARFEGVADLRHSVRATLEGWTIRPTDWNAANDTGPGTEVTFVATAAIKVQAAITLADGGAPERATLEFKAGRGSQSQAWTPAKPYAWVNPGTYEVRAVAGDHQELASAFQSATLAEGQPLAEFVFALAGRPGIHGKIRFVEAESPQSLRVFALPVPEGAEIDEVQLRNSGTSAWVAKNAGYSFRFLDLSPGRHALGATRTQNGPIARMDFVEVRESLAEHDLEIPPLERSEYVLVRALDPDGAPLRGYSVYPRYRSKRRSVSGNTVVMPQPDGSVRALHPQGNDDPEGRYHVTVTAAGYGSLEEEYRRGPASEVTVRFARPGKLHVAAQGHEGTRYAGMLHVYATRVVQNGNQTRWVGGGGGQLGADGTLTLDAVQPGEYRVTLSVGMRNRVNIAVRTVQVSGGEASLSVAVPPLHTITVHGDGIGGVYARSKNLDPQVSIRGVQGKDKWVLDLLPPGEYEIRASGKDRRTVTVPGTTEVHF